MHLDDPAGKIGQKRRVARQYAEKPFNARRHDHLHIFLRHDAGRCHQFQICRFSHAYCTLMLSRPKAGLLGSFLSELLAFFDGFLDGAHQIEGGLGKMVIITLDDAFKAGNRVFEADQLAG
jgi:hypothetical protein